MTFVVRTRSGQFSDETHPEGLVQASCVDVVDLGMQPGMNGEEVHKCKFVFETALRDSKGVPFRISTSFFGYTVSLGKKANLRKDLERWRGRQFTSEELAGFDIDSVLGAPAMLNVVHVASKKNGKVYANIDGIFKDTNPTKYTPTGTYVRSERTPVAKHEEPEPPEEFMGDDFDDEGSVPF